MTMVFYRFDKGEGDHLKFRFGNLLAYEGGIQHQLFAQAGEDFCFEIAFDRTGETWPMIMRLILPDAGLRTRFEPLPP